jgi:hypothetical protein
VYLDDGQVRALASDLCARARIRWWIIDLASPELIQMMGRAMGRHLANAPMKFAPPDGVAFFEALGWSVEVISSIFRSAAQFRRLPLFLRIFSFLPEPDPRKLGRARWSGVVRLGRRKP